MLRDRRASVHRRTSVQFSADAQRLATPVPTPRSARRSCALTPGSLQIGCALTPAFTPGSLEIGCALTPAFTLGRCTLTPAFTLGSLRIGCTFTPGDHTLAVCMHMLLPASLVAQDSCAFTPRPVPPHCAVCPNSIVPAQTMYAVCPRSPLPALVLCVLLLYTVRSIVPAQILYSICPHNPLPASILCALLLYAVRSIVSARTLYAICPRNSLSALVLYAVHSIVPAQTLYAVCPRNPLPVLVLCALLTLVHSAPLKIRPRHPRKYPAAARVTTAIITCRLCFATTNNFRPGTARASAGGTHGQLSRIIITATVQLGRIVIACITDTVAVTATFQVRRSLMADTVTSLTDTSVTTATVQVTSQSVMADAVTSLMADTVTPGKGSCVRNDEALVMARTLLA